MKNLKTILLLSTLLIALITSCSNDDDEGNTTIIRASDYTTSIDENTPTGTSLGTISATSDNNAILNYSITSQTPVNAVTINNTTGDLTVDDASVFDFETNTEITGVIDITTNSVSKTINFTITLLDVVAKKVLVLGSEFNSNDLDDVGQKIEDTNLFDVVDTYNSKNTLISSTELMAYDAVLLYTNNNPLRAIELGDNLAAFIDNGGGVVEATFGGNVSVTGDYNNYKVYDSSNNISQMSGTTRTLGTILDANHPIMNSVATFNGGTSSYYNTGILPITGATTIAEYDNGQPLVIVRNQIGPKNVSGVYVNFYPVSKDVRSDFWDTTTDGGLILGNALKWVGNK